MEKRFYPSSVCLFARVVDLEKRKYPESNQNQEAKSDTWYRQIFYSFRVSLFKMACLKGTFNLRFSKKSKRKKESWRNFLTRRSQTFPFVGENRLDRRIFGFKGQVFLGELERNGKSVWKSERKKGKEGVIKGNDSGTILIRPVECKFRQLLNQRRRVPSQGGLLFFPPICHPRSFLITISLISFSCDRSITNIFLLLYLLIFYSTSFHFRQKPIGILQLVFD